MEENLVQNMYRDSAEIVRGRFGDNVDLAVAASRRYVEFVSEHAPKPGSRILDMGCGGGWSTWLLRRSGHKAEGLDLHSASLEARAVDPELPYTQGDGQKIPFQDGTFDVVSMHAVLEHIPNPEPTLNECLRVLKPGGRLIVVGPNLLSFPLNLYWSFFHTWKLIKKGRIWESRTPELARHPGGNTMPESWFFTVHHLWQTIRKLTIERHQPNFIKRTPDIRPPFHADNDSSYYCNPMDILNWARSKGEVIPIQWWADDRRFARVFWPFTGGTWIVLQKK